METVELILVNYEMNTELKGGLVRTDTRKPVREADIEVRDNTPVTLTQAQVYSGKKIGIVRLPRGVDANALKIVEYIRETNLYKALYSWLNERTEESGKK